MGLEDATHGEYRLDELDQTGILTINSSATEMWISNMYIVRGIDKAPTFPLSPPKGGSKMPPHKSSAVSAS